ncbi:hypothetical protein C8Q76DRAFT_795335 [Earliella scabrosa]|nr:hypothetical protein C8Q76DRAFT_795335 [Earliella scabrosa]
MPPPRICEVIAAGGELPCAKPADDASEPPVLCRRHREECQRSCARYKAAARSGARVKKQLSAITGKTYSVADIELAKQLARSYIAALDEEIQGRRDHTARFFGSKGDEGHAQCIAQLEKERQRQANILSLLHCQLRLIPPHVVKESGIALADLSWRFAFNPTSDMPTKSRCTRLLEDVLVCLFVVTVLALFAPSLGRSPAPTTETPLTL